MVSNPEGFTDNSPMSPSQYVTMKNLVQENHSINFLKHWTPNTRLMSAGYVLPNQNIRKPEQEIICGQVFQSVVVIQK